LEIFELNPFGTLGTSLVHRLVQPKHDNTSTLGSFGTFGTLPKGKINYTIKEV